MLVAEPRSDGSVSFEIVEQSERGQTRDAAVFPPSEGTQFVALQQLMSARQPGGPWRSVQLEVFANGSADARFNYDGDARRDGAAPGEPEVAGGLVGPTVSSPEPSRQVLSPYEGRVRARALVLADLGKLDRAERVLVRALEGRPHSDLRWDLEMVRDQRSGRTRGDLGAELATEQEIVAPELTMLEYSQVDRQHDHHAAVRRMAQVCRWSPLALLAPMMLDAAFRSAIFGLLGLLVVVVVVLRRSRDERAVEVRRGLLQARPELRFLWVLTSVFLFIGVMQVASGPLTNPALRSGRSSDPAVVWGLAVLMVIYGLLSLAWRWSALLGSPRSARATHRSLHAVDDPIATTANWVQWRGFSTLGLLALGVAGWVLFHFTFYASYAGVPLIAAGATQLPDALTFWARRLRGSRTGGFTSPPAGSDQVLALVPLALVVAGFLV